MRAAGPRNFREAGDHAADLPQDVLATLGGTPHPLWRRIIAPSETRIRTLAASVGVVYSGVFRDLVATGRPAPRCSSSVSGSVTMPTVVAVLVVLAWAIIPAIAIAIAIAGAWRTRTRDA